MQPTMIQVECSLRALRAPDDGLGGGAATAVLVGPPQLPTEALARVAHTPAVRPDRLADVRARLAAGLLPGDDDIAERMVGRLVCDRLR